MKENIYILVYHLLSIMGFLSKKQLKISAVLSMHSQKVLKGYPFFSDFFQGGDPSKFLEELKLFKKQLRKEGVKRKEIKDLETLAKKFIKEKNPHNFTHFVAQVKVNSVINKINHSLFKKNGLNVDKLIEMVKEGKALAHGTKNIRKLIDSGLLRYRYDIDRPGHGKVEKTPIDFITGEDGLLTSVCFVGKRVIVTRQVLSGTEIKEIGKKFIGGILVFDKERLLRYNEERASRIHFFPPEYRNDYGGDFGGKHYRINCDIELFKAGLLGIIPGKKSLDLLFNAGLKYLNEGNKEKAKMTFTWIKEITPDHNLTKESKYYYKALKELEKLK